MNGDDFKGTKVLIESTDKLIDEVMKITTVHARFYELASDYYQKIGNHAEYYKNALRYLGCCRSPGVNVSDDDATLAQRAFTISLAGILGKDVYNFGELLLHPILNKLAPENVYIRDLLVAFNSGDLAKFEQLRGKWQTQKDLLANEKAIHEKITLLSLMELAFKSKHGSLSFNEISSATHLPIDEVELLVMKALSKELVKGSIDEVQSKVMITWVQPRVLNKKQIRNMKKRLESWFKHVSQFSEKLETKAQEIIA